MLLSLREISMHDVQSEIVDIFFQDLISVNICVIINRMHNVVQVAANEIGNVENCSLNGEKL